MTADVRVDSATVRSLARAHSAHAADLSATAAELAAFPVGSVGHGLGPVGDRFVAALSAAVTAAGAQAAALADAGANAAAITTRSARSYDDVQVRTAALISG
ncbi:hypothetical protein ACN27E_11535 [Mycobacterium sp. WMMD1722]|uniref:hypothetical protein n=1 Tax=Mycobacterium sp. WMMD1722 TaxID=3404117 RepID=UPI003BF5BF30